MNSNEFRIKQFINRGLNPVYEAIQISTGNVFCIKFVSIDNEITRNRFLREVNLLQKTKDHPHPNIIKYDSHYFEDKQSNQNQVYTTGCIVMEKGITNLYNFISKRNKDKVTHFDDYQVGDFMMQMIGAFAHLQRLDIAHRDIKPENILLFNEEALSFKLCDVGFGTMMEEDDHTISLTVGGTVGYFSPEMFKCYIHHAPVAQYNPYKSDVFSLGLVFIYFATQQEIDKNKRLNEYRKDADFEAFLKKQRKTIKLRYPKVNGMSKILKQMLEFNEKIRVDFIQLQQLIDANDYLELKSPAKVHQNWQSLTSLSEQQIYDFPDQEHINLDFNHLGRDPNEIQKLLENISKQIKHYPIQTFKLKLELNNLNVRQISPIVKILSRCHQLKELELHLWNNKLGNLGLLLICQSISSLTQLKKLHVNFANNILTCDGINQSLPMVVNFSQVEDLFLDFGMNQLSIECCEVFFEVIQTMPLLKKLHLNLESNLMNLFISKLLHQTLLKLPQLTHLSINFSNNLLQDQGLFALGECIQQLHYCQLTLWGCSIKDKGLEEFSKSLGKCDKIKDFQFILWNNQITEKGCEKFSEKLILMKHVVNLSINLSNNKINDQGVRFIAKAINEMPQLREIKLTCDKYQIVYKPYSISCTAQGLRYVTKFLQNNRLLTKAHLNFRANDIDHDGMALLFMGFDAATQLIEVVITLDHNPLEDKGVETLFKGLRKLKNIQNLTVNLEAVQSTGLSITGMLESIPFWPYLKTLNINYQKNQTDEADAINCRMRLKTMQCHSSITIAIKERIMN